MQAVAAPLRTPAQVALPNWLQTYRVRLDELGAAGDAHIKAALVATLQAREEVARELSAGAAAGSADDFLSLADLDARLRSQADRVERAIGVRTIRSLALTSSSSDEQGWWWKLDEQLPRPLPVWTVFSALFFAGAVSLLAEIARRFFAEGPDFTGALYTLVQAGVTLLAGSTLLGTGGNAFDKWLDGHDVRRHLHPLMKTGLAVLVFLLVLLGFSLLPRVASSYIQAGVARNSQGNLGLAIQDFKRALSLSPDFPQAHYNLGRADEEVLDYQSAAIEYQKAIQAERELYPAYNSLARLYIVQKKDASGALGLIDQALAFTVNDKSRDPGAVIEARFALLKNRGWANLVSANYAQAQADLGAALQIDAQRASAHCLLAQVHENRHQPSIADWERCLGFSSGATDVEPVWLATAQDRVVGLTEVRK